MMNINTAKTLSTTTGYTLELVYTTEVATTYRCTHYKGMRLALDMQDHLMLFAGADGFVDAGSCEPAFWAGQPVTAKAQEQAFINRAVTALDAANTDTHNVYVHWFRIDYGFWLDAEEVLNAGGLTEYLESLGLSVLDVNELMVQDWEYQDAEGLANRCLGNYGCFDWKMMSELLEVSVPAEVLTAGLECGIDPEAIEEAYVGEWESDEDMAYDYWEQTGMLESIPEAARGYIDWEMVARDMMWSGMSAANGHYFHAA